ncbi:MAG TPA: tetratricopeptide repeat protein [Kofleriaceae bacterium]|nr:tetratricopeptide repeat protein [Kofleriaceae bacterium]
MNVRPSSLVLACALLLTAAAPALAQQQPVGDKKKALDLYDRAKVQYDLGHWKPAIDLWVQAYETFNAPEFLFNIGQAYRQDGNCDRALFFYRRYLASRPNAKNRGEVEGFMKEMEAKCKTSGTAPEPGEAGGEPAAGTGGTGTPAGSDGGTGAVKSGAGTGADVGETEADPDAGVDEEVEGEADLEVDSDSDQARFFAVRVAAGACFPSLGPLDVGTLVAFAIGAGHPFYLGKFVVEPGVLATYTPVPWETEASMTSGTAGMTGLLGNIGLAYQFLPRLAARAEVGAGVLIFSGLGEPGAPFLQGGTQLTDGKSIGLFNARVALGAEYAVTRNLIVNAQPVVFSYSPSSPLRNDIEKITQFEILVGVGYRM